MALPLSVLSFLALGAAAPRVAHAQNPGFTEFAVPSGSINPFNIVTGPDGNLWFTEVTGPNVGTITTSGSITEYPIPNYTSGSLGTGGIAVGGDGSLWVTDVFNNTIDKVTTAGTVTTNASLTTANAQPFFITSGPDGNLWFTEQNANYVGKITTAGAITEYAISASASTQQIATGPDGALWFAEQGINKIGRVTTSGTVTEYQLGTGAAPAGVVAGPDGNLWVAEYGTGIIDKVSTTGTVLAQYALTNSGAGPSNLSIGPDGNVWFTEFSGNAIGTITSAGVVTEYPTGESGAPYGITNGPDGNVWYSEYHGGTIGRFAFGACASLGDSASPGLVGPGSSETVGVTLGSCGATPLNSVSTATATAVPQGCPAAPGIPSFITSTLPYGQSDHHSTTFAAPSCPGTYTVTSQTTAGATVMATGTASYTVLAVGGGALFSTSTRPQWVAAGSDGNLWFTDSSSSLGQVTPSGVVTYISSVFQGSASALQLTTGADGDLYVNIAIGGGSGPLSNIANVKPGGYGGATFRWEVPVSGTSINDLAPGPDGNVWFAGQPSVGPGGTIGFVTPAGKVKLFHLPLADGAPFAITSGSDGALWFSLSSGQIGRITTAGAVTLFPVPAPMTALSSASNTLALGPDGNVWFLGVDSSGNDVVGRISPAGVASEFATNENAEATGITAGADGNLWVNRPELFKCGFGGGVTRVTPSGVLTDYGAGCNDTNDRFNIVAGPDGNVWNSAYYGIGINLIATGAPGTCKPLAATAGASSVAHGGTQTLAATIANCGTTPQLMRLTSKTTSSCGFSATTKHVVPLQPFVQTAVSDSTTTTCKGTYTDKLTLSVGTTVVATAKVTYQAT